MEIQEMLDKLATITTKTVPAQKGRSATVRKAVRKDGTLDAFSLVDALRESNEQRAARNKAARPGSPEAARKLKEANSELQQIQEELDEDAFMPFTRRMMLENQKSVLLGSLPTLKSDAYRAGR